MFAFISFASSGASARVIGPPHWMALRTSGSDGGKRWSARRCPTSVAARGRTPTPRSPPPDSCRPSFQRSRAEDCGLSASVATEVCGSAPLPLLPKRRGALHPRSSPAARSSRPPLPLPRQLPDHLELLPPFRSLHILDEELRGEIPQRPLSEVVENRVGHVAFVHSHAEHRLEGHK